MITHIDIDQPHRQKSCTRQAVIQWSWQYLQEGYNAHSNTYIIPHMAVYITTSTSDVIVSGTTDMTSQKGFLANQKRRLDCLT